MLQKRNYSVLIYFIAVYDEFREEIFFSLCCHLSWWPYLHAWQHSNWWLVCPQNTMENHWSIYRLSITRKSILILFLFQVEGFAELSQLRWVIEEKQLQRDGKSLPFTAKEKIDRAVAGKLEACQVKVSM